MSEWYEVRYGDPSAPSLFVTDDFDSADDFCKWLARRNQPFDYMHINNSGEPLPEGWVEW